MKKFLPFFAIIALIFLVAAQPKIGTRFLMLETNGFGTNTTIANLTIAGVPLSSVQYNSNGVVSGSSAFVFTNNNVGIGTATPGEDLSVAGSVAIGSDSANGYKLWVSGGDIRITGSIYYSNPFAFSEGSGVGYGIISDAASGISFQSGAIPARMIISTNGNVGIATNVPVATLHVHGTAKIGAGGTVMTNIRHGISGAMVLGTVTVTDAGCTANTRYFFSAHTLGTVSLAGGYYASTRTAGTSFIITSSQATETSTIDWMAIEP